MTAYLILERVPSLENTWEVIGTVDSRSARSAIRERIDGAAQSADYHGDGEYVAVPVRSWQPVTAKTETRTALKLS